MLHIHRLPLIFTICCIELSACAPATPLPSETFTPTEIPPTATATLTPTPTETPTPAETPAKIIDLDINGDGTPDYTGTVIESKSMEINEGETVNKPAIKIHYDDDFGIASMGTQGGYLTKYEIVKVNELKNVNLVFFTMKYFRKNLPPISAEFSVLEKLIITRGFDGENTLGDPLNVILHVPIGSDYTEESKDTARKFSKLTRDEFEIVFPQDVRRLKIEEVYDLLTRSTEEFLDLKFEVDVSSMMN